jgi:hypothetical protein
MVESKDQLRALGEDVAVLFASADLLHPSRQRRKEIGE